MSRYYRNPQQYTFSSLLLCFVLLLSYISHLYSKCYFSLNNNILKKFLNEGKSYIDTHLLHLWHPSFLCINEISILSHFTFVWRVSFNISYTIAFLEVNSFHFFTKISIFALINEIYCCWAQSSGFAVSFFCTLNMSLHCLPPCIFSVEKSTYRTFFSMLCCAFLYFLHVFCAQNSLSCLDLTL